MSSRRRHITCVLRLGATVLVAALAACSVDGALPGESASGEPSSVPLLKALVDEVSGTIALPADEFMLSEAEVRDVYSAHHVAMIDCLQAVGIESVEKRGRLIPDNDMSRVYGLWRMADAERYGYIIPESDEKLAALARNSEGGSGISDAEMAARHECAKTPELVRFENPWPQGVWVKELSSARRAVRSSEEWNAVMADWETCLTTQGLDAEPDGIVPIGVDHDAVSRGEVTENDVRIAVADVTCKNEVDFIQRLADLEAAAQSPVIAQYRDEMLAARAELDAILADARTVLAEAGL